MATKRRDCTGPSGHFRGRDGASLGSALALLLLGGMVAACDSYETTEAAVESASIAEVAARTDLTPAQTRGIEALKSAWDAAWAAKDAAAYAANYAEDADVVNPVGGILAGREAIRAQHAFLFSGPFAGSTSVSEIRRTVFLTGTIVIVDVNLSLSGYQGLPPGLVATVPGVVRTRVKLIVVKEGANWEILAQQMTPLAPGASF